MKLFVILLAIGLSSTEKLNLGYLPPSGAELAGGSSNDLQTPLEYSKDNIAFDISDNESTNFEEDEPQTIAKDNIIRNPDSLIDNGTNNDKGLLSTGTETPNKFTQTPIYYPTNNYDTVDTKIPEMVYDASTHSHFDNTPRYPTVSTTQGNDKNGYHYRRPENMPILAVTKRIVDSYNPNAFRMYGGNPMIIKSKLYSVNDVYKESKENFDYPSNDLYTSDQIDRGSQNKLLAALNDEHREGTYQSIIKLVPPETSATLNRRNKIRNELRRPQAESDRTASVINYKNIINPNGYAYSFDTSNGIHMDETATTSNGNKASGSYSYIGDDGKVYSVVYTADENGFRPKGDHLPKAPPIPDAIQRLIVQAKNDKSDGIFNDGSYDEEKYGHMKYQGPIERYLQKMTVNFKPRNRNRVKNATKIQRKPILTFPTKTKNNRVSQEIVLLKNINSNQRLVNDINGRFGMRNVAAEEDTKQLSKSSVKDVKNIITNNRIYFSNNNTTIPKHNYQGVNSGKNINMYKTKDSGYYYVPPRQIFVEGKHQDQTTNLETVNQFSSFSEDFKTGSLPQSFYYVDQRNHHDQSKNQLDITDDFTTKGPELNFQTSGKYENTNQDHNLNTGKEKVLTTANRVITIITSPKPYSNTLSTKDYKQNSTNNYERDTAIYTEEEDTVANEETEKELDFINISTTPMPSQAKDSNDLSNSNDIQKQFDKAKITHKYSTDEGYLITKPDVQVFFDDIPSSTYSPIHTDNDFQTEGVLNIKVDGFGRPIEDSHQFYISTDSYTESQYGNDKPINNFVKPIQESAKINDETTLNFSLYEEQDTKNDEIEDNDKIKGEDFSGPKQNQGFDSTFGYFY